MWEEAGLGTPFVCADGRPTKITFGDLDLVTERHGHFLFIEGKRQDEKPSLGQSILFDALTADGHAVLLLYGNPPTDIREIQWWGDERKPSSARDLHHTLTRWFQRADNLSPRPRQRP
jgi:hypothetical protein